MTKKILLFVLSFFMAGLVLGCQTTEPTQTELNLVISGLNQPNEKVFFRPFVKLFEAETGITVNLSYVTPSDLILQIGDERSTFQVESDVIMVDTANMKSYVNSGWMTDISSFMDGFSDRTVTGLFSDSTTKDGKMFFVPVSFDIYISIFNKEALPSIPETVQVIRNESEEIIQISSITWEEYAAWGKAVFDDTGTPKTGFPMASSNSQLLYPMGGMALAFGSPSFPKINDSGAMNAWNIIAGMAEDGAIVDSSILSTVNQPTPLLSSGALWLSFGHMGPIGAAFDADPDQFVLGPAPSAGTTQTAGSTAGAWAFGIVKDAIHIQAAEAWIEFMTDPEINYLYCSGLGGVISPIAEVIDHLGTSNTDKIMKVGLASYQGTMKIAILDTSRFSSWAAVKDIYTDLYERLLTGVPLTQGEADVFQQGIDNLTLT